MSRASAAPSRAASTPRRVSTSAKPIAGSTGTCPPGATVSRPSRGACRSRAPPTNSSRTRRRSTTSERIFCVTAKDIEGVQALGAAIEGEVAKAVFGQTELTRMVTIALLAGGHILLEGPPGTAKTLLAQAFARAVGLDYGRIQFTPDLMPGDILGSNLFNFQTSSFTLTKGPIFTELLLADEINRTPPKTQAALLEAMQERRVTLGGEPPDRKSKRLNSSH